MGGRESKSSCISYEDAVKRLSETELRRIKNAFKKSAEPTTNFLSKRAFLYEVLCEGVPSVVADWLFSACGGTQKGISFRDLICGLVLLTRGTEDEKIRLLWNLYCNESGTYILKSDYAQALQLESRLRNTNNSEILNLGNTSILISLFSKSDKINFDVFREWIIHHRTATVISKWLLSETCVHLTSELETPTFYQSLAGVTHLEEQDIVELEKVFWKLKNASVNNQLDFDSLGPLVSPPIPKAALSGLLSAFDENRDGHIDFKELCCGVSAACRGPIVERSKFCFKIFDVDRDGSLSNEEIKQMIDVLLLVAKESNNANFYETITAKHVMNDVIRYLKKTITDTSIKNGNEVSELSSNYNRQNMTQEDFMMWNIESKLNLVQPFLDLLFEICHVIFGLKPQCRHIEYDIVKGWLSREQRRGYRVGQFWYLISSEWWGSWIQYTRFITTTPCLHCKNAYSIKNFGVDEAMVCDESFTSNSSESTGEFLATTDSSSLGSTSSGVSCGRHPNLPPGPIDNTNLVITNIYKTVKTLTGEGGHLRRDVTLAQGHDFELVPFSLWKALSHWYGELLSLPRQVIQPPNSIDVDLELYPLYLRILRHQEIPIVHQSVSSWGTVAGGYGPIVSGSGYNTISSMSQNLQPPKKYLAYTAAFSRLATIKRIAEFLCERLNLKLEDIRLWHIVSYGDHTHNDVAYILDDENMTLEELSVKDNDQILLEVRNKDLTWPEELGSLSLSSNIVQDRRPTTISVQSLHAPGATGLHNLGNTCFINSALQVLFNTQPLTQYFKNNMHMAELNIINKLGTKGQLATKYGELLSEVWTATTRSIAPLKLRMCITKHAPQFSGGGQHDSQELLEWFLDALHEDLNRVTEKPYTELKDSDGRPDAIVAEEAWNQHHARNQSIIIDLFYGQLKSKVICLCCGRESVRFDPFSLLSLPLPLENFIYCEVLVILLDGSVPIKYGLRLNSDSKYNDLKLSLSTLCNVNPKLMLICELANSQVKCILNIEQKIIPSTATELYIYELPECNDECKSITGSIIGINIEKGLKDIQRSPALLISSDTTCSSNQNYPTEQKSGPSLIRDRNCNNSTEYKLNEINTDEISASKRTSKFQKEYRIFQPSEEISSSPGSTFTSNNNILTTNLYENNIQNYNNDENEIIRQKRSFEELDEDLQSECLVEKNKNEKTECPCKTLCDNRDENDSLTSNFRLSKGKNNYLSNTFQDCQIGKYLIAVHRKLTRQDTYFLSYHKTRPSLFGIPLLIPCYENATNKDLYCAVWMQVSRFLSPLPPTADHTANHAADCDDSLGYDFPFILRAVTDGGRVCALCSWSNFCRGCKIPCNDDILLQGSFVPLFLPSSNTSTPKLSNKFSSCSLQSDTSRSSTPSSDLHNHIDYSEINIAIDWDPTALHLRYQSTREKLWIEHETVAICRKQQTEPVDLNHCLQAFTSEEKLEEWYYCSHCEGKKPATKKLQIWKLPPILIIHLKRFNCVNGKWIKSQKPVHFPFDEFDPTPYLASVPQETILRHKEILEIKYNLKNIDEKENEIIKSENLYNNFVKSDIEISKDLTKEIPKKYPEKCDIINDGEIIYRKNKNDLNTLEKRKRLISTSLSKTPIIDGCFTDFHQHKLNPEVDPLDPKYQLYAVVSHTGMLNGGHYVSYAANPNGSWYCYNDSSCRETHSRPNIDPSSAYLLFYERKGLDYKPYLPNIEGRTFLTTSALENDANDSDLRKMCVIS